MEVTKEKEKISDDKVHVEVFTPEKPSLQKKVE